MSAILTTTSPQEETEPRPALIAKQIKSYRLQCAAVILGNHSYLEQIRQYPDCKYEVLELCDQYSICICLSWLATKYGFPTYRPVIDSSTAADYLPLLENTDIARLYPLNLPSSLTVRDHSTDALVQFLENNFNWNLYLAGALYQHILANQLHLRSDGSLYIQKDDDGRVSGEFYTPEKVVQYCLKEVLSADSSELMNRIKESSVDITDTAGNIDRDFKMLDPACGTGNFLLGAIDYVQTLLLNSNEIHRFITRSVFGFDIDGRAIDICRAVMLIRCSAYLRDVLHKQSQNEFSAEIKRLLNKIRAHVRVENTVFSTATESGAYDLVIGNPPYVSFGSRNQQALTVEWQKFLRSRYPSSTEYKIRLYSVFQEISVNLAARGGYVALLVPDAFLNGSYYQKLRQFLLKNTTIISLSELPSNAIAGAVVGNWCVACYRKNEDDPKPMLSAHFVKVHKVTRDTTRSYQLPFDILISTDKSRFQMVFCDEDAKLLKVVKDLPALKGMLTGHTGLRARKGQASIISEKRKSDSFKRGITSGARVQQFLVEFEDIWLEISPAKLFAGGFDPSIVERTKIMMRQTADRIIAAVDDSGLYHLNNVHSFAPVHRVDPSQIHFLCAVLNSRLFLHLYRLKSREQGRALAQIDIEMIEAMPLPVASQSQAQRIALAAMELRNHKLQAKDANKLSCDEKRNLIRELERQIDDAVYELFEISPDLIKHIDEMTLA